jgi:hypothetical protein
MNSATFELKSFDEKTGLYVETEDSHEAKVECYDGEGIHVCLSGGTSPTVFIDRLVDGWLVAVHPEDGGDAICCIQLKDDKKTVLQTTHIRFSEIMEET